MIYKVIEYAYLICCMICMISVGEWTFHWTVRDKRRFVIAGIIYAMGLAFLHMQSFTLAPFFLLFYLGEIIAWALISNGNLPGRLLKILAVFYGVGIVEEGFMLLLEIFVQEKTAEEVLRLTAILLCMGSLYILTRQKWYKKLIGYMVDIPGKGAVLILCAIIVGLGLVSYGNFIRDMVEEKGIFLLYQMLFITEILTVIGIVVWVVQENSQKKYYREQNALKEEVLQTQREYYKTIYEKDCEMRSFRHDVANQLGMLQMLLRNEDWKGATVQLESISSAFQEASFHKVHVGDEMLDAIFSMMKQKTEQKEIRLEIKGVLQREKQYNSYELCTIFSNAIRNAIEACEKLGGNGPIHVNILEEKETLMCMIENPATEEMYQQIQLGRTSKENKENHGYGVGNIRRAVKHLNGELEYRYKDGKITLEIFI